jgi:hypothetical protein
MITYTQHVMNNTKSLRQVKNGCQLREAVRHKIAHSSTTKCYAAFKMTLNPVAQGGSNMTGTDCV